jgi:hypothetical protein
MPPDSASPVGTQCFSQHYLQQSPSVGPPSGPHEFSPSAPSVGPTPPSASPSVGPTLTKCGPSSPSVVAQHCLPAQRLPLRHFVASSESPSGSSHRVLQPKRCPRVQSPRKPSANPVLARALFQVQLRWARVSPSSAPSAVCPSSGPARLRS